MFDYEGIFYKLLMFLSILDADKWWEISYYSYLQLPTPRSEIAGAALNGKIYIIGGFDESEAGINSKHEKLISSLRTTLENECNLDKEATSYDDIIDALRLA